MSTMKVYHDKENRKLVYIKESAMPDFWDKHWDTEKFKEAIEKEKNSRFILKTLNRYVPDKKGRILEGGCGQGWGVYCMQTHGYESIGVDFAKETIRRAKESFPELDVRVGDVRSLQFPDNYFTGYWSLGVIEHFWEGYSEILKEAKRVIRPEGYLFLTFPFMSSLRRLKVRFGLYREFNGGRKSFYQFALDPKMVINDFEGAGFKLIDKKRISGIKGFKDEVSIFKALLQKLFDYQGENFWVKGFRFTLDRVLATFAGHMIFLVFRNKK